MLQLQCIVARADAAVSSMSFDYSESADDAARRLAKSLRDAEERAAIEYSSADDESPLSAASSRKRGRTPDAVASPPPLTPPTVSKVFEAQDSEEGSGVLTRQRRRRLQYAMGV